MTKDLRKLKSKERLAFWTNHIKSWKESKLTQAEYCRQNNLQKQLFSKWKTKMIGKEEKGSERFVEISVGPTYNAIPDSIELVIRDTYKINIRSNFNPEALKKLLMVLGV